MILEKNDVSSLKWGLILNGKNNEKIPFLFNNLVKLFYCN